MNAISKSQVSVVLRFSREISFEYRWNGSLFVLQKRWWVNISNKYVWSPLVQSTSSSSANVSSFSSLQISSLLLYEERRYILSAIIFQEGDSSDEPELKTVVKDSNDYFIVEKGNRCLVQNIDEFLEEQLTVHFVIFELDEE